MSWREIQLPGPVRKNLPGIRGFQREAGDGGYLTVLVAREPEGWHLSLSHQLRIADPFTGRQLPGRLPTWDELKEVRYRFLPDEIVVAQVLPPKDDYVNEHETCMHLWELPAELGATFRKTAAR